MADISLRAKTGTLTKHGKRLIAESMYAKGKSFIVAAILLGKYEGHEYVALHLVSQGIETSLKGVLLFKDYDTYKPLLKRKLGHNLDAIVAEAITAFNLKPVRPPVAAQLHMLNSLYSKHLLRYGSFYDVLVDARTIPSNLVLRRVAAFLRLADRQVSFARTGA